MKKKTLCLILFVLFRSIVILSAEEEKTVILDDGSRINGIVMESETEITIDNPLLGKIIVPLSAVYKIIEKSDDSLVLNVPVNLKILSDEDVIMTELIRFVPGSIENINAGKPAVVAVKKITVNGAYSVNDRVFETKLINELVKKQYFTIVERQALEVLLKEQRLSLSGLVEEEESKIGELLGVDAFMDINISVKNDHSMTAVMKITDVETNTQIWQDDFSGSYSGDLKLASGLTYRTPYEYTFSTYDLTGNPPYELDSATGHIFGLSVRMGQRLSLSRFFELGLHINFIEQDFLAKKLEDSVSGSNSYKTVTASSGGIMINHPNMSIAIVLKLHPAELFNSSMDLFQPYVGFGLLMNRLMHIREQSGIEEEVFNDFMSASLTGGLEFRLTHSFAVFAEYTRLLNTSVISSDMNGQTSWGPNHFRCGVLYYIFK